jgi:hypothetical protein
MLFFRSYVQCIPVTIHSLSSRITNRLKIVQSYFLYNLFQKVPLIKKQKLRQDKRARIYRLFTFCGYPVPDSELFILKFPNVKWKLGGTIRTSYNYINKKEKHNRNIGHSYRTSNIRPAILAFVCFIKVFAILTSLS